MCLWNLHFLFFSWPAGRLCCHFYCYWCHKTNWCSFFNLGLRVGKCCSLCKFCYYCNCYFETAYCAFSATTTVHCCQITVGTSHSSKSDEFSEKFQTAFDPPSLFSENVRKRPIIKVQNLQYKFLDWKWPHLGVFLKFIRSGSPTRL